MPPSLIQIDTSIFFDRDAVLKALDTQERRLLSRAGAFVRRSARSSIRKRKKASAPGSPPSSHTGEYKKSILFGYDKPSRSVVIGPSINFGGAEVPTLLEFGGVGAPTRRDMLVPNGSVRGAGGRFESGGARLVKRGSRLRYRARPHMLPALEANAPKFPRLFLNSVRS